jgi:transposase InsO family protein
VLQEPGWSGRSVAEVCSRHKICRQTFYEWQRRYDADGLAGLMPRSRRPLRSPGQLDPDLEDRIVRLRKQHGWGPAKIRDALRGQDGLVIPAASTVQQVLARRGLTGALRRRVIEAPEPSQRFERDACNELWQIDGAYQRLADDSAYWSVELLDDHSRYCLAILFGLTLTGHLAWTATRTAAARYGLPGWMLSDNGRCFTGRLDGQTVTFERRIREAGIRFIHSSPYHPQTCGKVCEDCGAVLHRPV